MPNNNISTILNHRKIKKLWPNMVNSVSQEAQTQSITLYNQPRTSGADRLQNLHGGAHGSAAPPNSSFLKPHTVFFSLSLSLSLSHGVEIQRSKSVLRDSEQKQFPRRPTWSRNLPPIQLRSRSVRSIHQRQVRPEKTQEEEEDTRIHTRKPHRHLRRCFQLLRCHFRNHKQRNRRYSRQRIGIQLQRPDRAVARHNGGRRSRVPGFARDRRVEAEDCHWERRGSCGRDGNGVVSHRRPGEGGECGGGGFGE